MRSPRDTAAFMRGRYGLARALLAATDHAMSCRHEGNAEGQEYWLKVYDELLAMREPRPWRAGAAS